MVLVEEMGEKSVLITEHRYHYKHYMANSSGKFCVQFMVFKNTVDGNNVLEWWRAKCEDECTLDPERGLCGDQKYLDDWESRFGNAVFNTPHFGSGIAQWNLQNYELIEDDDKWYVRDTISKVIMPLIFFHYQGLKELTSGIWKFDFDDVGKDYIEKIVVPYIINIYSEEKKINYKHSYNNLYKKLIRYRFDPIPYMGEKKLLITNYDKEKKKIDIRMAFENKEVYIIYDVHNDHGGWISINEISDYAIFSYIHELIWDILCLTIYEDEKNEEQIIFSICERKTRGMYVMVEFTTSPDKELDIKYPGYYKNEIYRIQDDNGIYKDKSMASIIDMNERFHELK
ncbi:hypothetical protein UYO_3057 [Lachnospiraceae bacterium JC7]|nr:hypothetical protein UYO_3057 [Lachnospiraceae bacterium JC7]